MANFSIPYLHDPYALHPNWFFLQTPAQKRFSLGSRKRPFTNDAVLVAEDGVGFSFGIREAFLYFCQEFDQASLVFKIESERIVGESELVVKLIYDFNKVALSPGS